MDLVKQQWRAENLAPSEFLDISFASSLRRIGQVARSTWVDAAHGQRRRTTEEVDRLAPNRNGTTSLPFKVGPKRAQR